MGLKNTDDRPKSMPVLWASFLTLNRDTWSFATKERYSQLYDKYIIGCSTPVASDRMLEWVRFVLSEAKATPVAHNQLRSLLIGMLEHARNLGLRQDNPAKLTKSIPIAPRTRQISRYEMQRLLDRLETFTPDFKLYVKTLLLTGMRRGELECATSLMLEGSSDVLVIPADKTKSGKPRTIFLPVAAAAALRGCIGLTVFGLIPDINRRWTKLCSVASIPDLHIHDLRHALATCALDADMPIEIIGRLLGHSNVQNTRIYAEFTRRQAKAAAGIAAEAMQKFMDGTTE